MVEKSNGRKDELLEPGLKISAIPELSIEGKPKKDEFRRSIVTHELEWRETLHGQHPGESYIRILHPHRRNFRRTAPGRLLATERVLEPKGFIARISTRIKRFLIGTPLTTAQLAHERLTKINALAVFSSDAVSSSAYATEEILLVLIAAGSGALSFTLPIAVAISLLLAVVVSSYRQTIMRYPLGGGTYIVAKDNLGTWPALVGASSLLFGYLLTVAVSVSAGVAAITSAFPSLAPQSISLGVFFVLLITVINLRGIRESGAIFAAPTYSFIVSMIILLAVGVYKVIFPEANSLPQPVEVVNNPAEPIALFLIVRAFVSGCVGLTGTEAVADGVPAFKVPESRNAVVTLIWMGIILGTLLIGVSFLASSFQIVPVEGETATSQIARVVFGTGWFYYVFQITTMLILILAANTSFADFPRLSYFLARDNFLPHQFQFRGDRLAFSTGILVLGLLSCLLIIGFQAETHALIPLYAVGVFVSFTISQSSMVKRWWTRREPGWHYGLVMNGAGALVTGMVAVIFTATKFFAGAWVVLILIPFFVLILKGINAHYRNVSQELELAEAEGEASSFPVPQLGNCPAIVPITTINQETERILAYAREISSTATAVHITKNPAEKERFLEDWLVQQGERPVRVLEPNRRAPLLVFLDFLKETSAANPNTPVAVVLPRAVPGHWWNYLVSDLSTVGLRVALFFCPNVVVVDFPSTLRETASIDSPVVVPLGEINHATVRTVNYARTISRNVTALNVSEDEMIGEKLAEKWRQWVGLVPLVVLESPYRSLGAPLLAYIDAISAADPDKPIVVVLSEFVPKHWWEFFLHNQSALRLRLALFSRPNVIIVHFPYHLGK